MKYLKFVIYSLTKYTFVCTDLLLDNMLEYIVSFHHSTFFDQMQSFSSGFVLLNLYLPL
jgi:hypothetical protein